MEFLKSLFDLGALTFEQFETEANKNGLKLADLSAGNYVCKNKFYRQ